MQHDQRAQAPFQVGQSPEAREMNCTDEEAQILTRNFKPYVDRSDRAASPVWLFFESLIFNRGAALFFGTLGYWFFGMLMIGWSQQGVSVMFFMKTGFYPLDMFITNPFIMTGFCFALILGGLREYQGDPREARGALWGGLAMMVVMISVPIAYLGSLLMGMIFLVTFAFALNSPEFYDMASLIMFLLPGGYLAALKMSQEL